MAAGPPVSVVVATYGDDPTWPVLAERAARSVGDQALVVRSHDKDLASARNRGLELVRTEWVIHLDADDELEPGYVYAMLSGGADVRAPSVRYVRDGQSRSPRMMQVAGHTHGCTADCLRDGNWIVVGAMVRTELAQQVGWRDWPCYEDWDFFQRCWLAGGTVEPVLTAIYRAHVRLDSRNRAPSMAFRNKVHQQIVAANLP